MVHIWTSQDDFNRLKLCLTRRKSAMRIKFIGISLNGEWTEDASFSGESMDLCVDFDSIDSRRATIDIFLN